MRCTIHGEPARVGAGEVACSVSDTPAWPPARRFNIALWAVRLHGRPVHSMLRRTLGKPGKPST
jgi:hypothetical protein